MMTKNAKIEKLTEENKHLRNQHLADLETMKRLKTAAAEINVAADTMILSIVKELGTQVYDDDGTLIGARIEIPKPVVCYDKIVIEPYEKYTGLDKQVMYRIGVVIDGLK